MRKLGLALATALVGLSIASATAQPAESPAGRQSCFFVNQYWNWKAPNDKTIYVHVFADKFYRLDLASSCPALMWPNPHLVMNVHGPDTICNALDWQLSVVDGGIHMPCIVRTMTQLSADQAASIPPKYKP